VLSLTAVIDVLDLELRYGEQIVFSGVSANILRTDRIALAGRNGAGKTTFFKALLGQVDLDGGDVVVGRGVRIGYLPQDGLEVEGRPLVEEVETSDASIQSLKTDLDQLYHGLTGDAERDAEALDSIHVKEALMEVFEAGKLRAKTQRILGGLGFSPERFEDPTDVFSGGWQMRIGLAKLLLQNPDLLLLDEPTNHLDLPSQRWLENYLRQYQGALMLISHDRAFLDTLANKTYYLSRSQLEIYAGNYSYFETQSQLRKDQLIAQKRAQERQIAETERFIERFRAKNTKATQVQSRIKQLEKVERISIESDEKEVAFEFPPAPRSNQVLISLQNLHKAYGPIRLFEGFNFSIERQQKLAVVGVNGAGKSTLAKILAGEETLDEGELRKGEKTQLSYFAQHQAEQLDPTATVLRTAMDSGVGSELKARSMLGAFLFSGDAVFKTVGVLSGGEKNRLALAKILLRPCNLLILDEPTNHLDIQSKSILQQALIKYDGTCLIISHDRDFLDPIVNQTLEISPRGHRMFWCNVSGYLDKVENEESDPFTTTPEGSAKTVSVKNPKLDRKRRVEMQNAMAPLKQAIKKWETESIRLEEVIADWEEKMKDPAFFSNRPGQADDLAEYDRCKRELDRALEEWEAAQARFDKLEGEFA
jgi:ATP-binding cassette subfamily F protein 3